MAEQTKKRLNPHFYSQSSAGAEKPIEKKQYESMESGTKPPTKGHKKPFNYKLWNTLRRLGRVK